MIGHIELIIGPMFSGKSTELLRRINRFNISKHKCILIKYLNDNRYNSNNVITHDKIEYNILSIKTDNISNIFNELNKYDIIGIDEGQFYKDINLVNNLANNGKIIIIAALDCTFEMKPFTNIIEIIHLCEKIVKLNSICMKCYKNNASFNKRITNDTNLELIGGTDKYISICRYCLNN